MAKLGRRGSRDSRELSHAEDGRKVTVLKEMYIREENAGDSNV
jgi:hypothetical protein